MTPLQSAAAAAESYLQSQRALEGLPAADILAELVIAAYEKAGGASAEIERLTRERDEALDRADELEGYAEQVSVEFEKDCWKAMRSLLEECGFDWSGDDVVTAEDARETIHGELKYRSDSFKSAVVRAEAEEKSNAELREEILALNVNDEELLRQRNRCETEGSYIKIWNVWLQRLIDHERGLRILARVALSKSEGDGK